MSDDPTPRPASADATSGPDPLRASPPQHAGGALEAHPGVTPLSSPTVVPPTPATDATDATARAHPSGGSDTTMMIGDLPRLPPTSLEGQRWDDFELHEELGRGGMGAVYRARQISLDRVVALKVMLRPADADFRHRFQREAKALAQLDSPHVVKIFYSGEHLGQPFFAMEFLVGKDLSQRFQEGWRPSHQEALEIVLQAARGLQAAAERGIVHRDIKPANLHMSPQGVVRLMDFGLVRMTSEQELTNSGTVLGTVQYFSPEQGRGERGDHRSDIYSLGVVLFRLVTGRLPFTAETTASLIYQHVHVAPPPPRRIDPTIHPALERLILRCLEKDPAQRFPDASTLIRALQEFQQHQTASLAPAPTHRPRLALVGILLGVLVALVGLGLLVHRELTPGATAPAASERPLSAPTVGPASAAVPGASAAAAAARPLAAVITMPASPPHPANGASAPLAAHAGSTMALPLPGAPALAASAPVNPRALARPDPIGHAGADHAPMPSALDATTMALPAVAGHAGEPLGAPGLSAPMRTDDGWRALLTLGSLHEVFRWIPHGTFTMGSPPYEQNRHDDEIPHTVTLSHGFWMEENACSQELWSAVMGDNPSRPSGAQLPVNRLSRDDCHRFLATLARQLPGLRVRLPWEAEWEYACRAGTDAPYPWKGTLTTEEACFDASSPRAVGHGRPNPWGLRDMLGNVVVWCEDDYQAYPDAPSIDPHPRGEPSGVGRGGCWKDTPSDCRCAHRFHAWVSTKGGSMGMRLVVDGPSQWP